MMSNFIPDSPPTKKARREGKKENRRSAIEFVTCMNCGIEHKKKNCTFCIDKECHDDLFYDWITYKYRDDPTMLHVSKE